MRKHECRCLAELLIVNTEVSEIGKTRYMNCDSVFNIKAVHKIIRTELLSN